MGKFFPSDPEPEPEPEPPPYQTPQEPDLESLEVVDIYYFSKTDGRVDIALQVRNPNSNHGAEEMNYTLSFMKGGKAIKEFDDSSYILPGEEKYIVLLNQDSGGSFDNIKMDINSVAWQELSEFFTLDLDVFDIRLERLPSENTFYARLRAFVKNNSIFGLTDIRVAGLLFDASGELIAVGRTSIQTVLEGEMREVEMFWPNQVPLDEVATTEVRAYSNVLKNDNFVREYGVEETPTPPSRRRDDSRNYFQLPEAFDNWGGWSPF